VDKIRILELIQTGGVRGAVGGAETVLLNIAHLGDQSRFDVRTLVVGGRGGLDERLRQYGHPVDTFEFRHSYNRDLIGCIRSLIHRHRIDIVHSHLSRMNMYGFLASCFTPATNIMTIHGLTEFTGRLGRLYYAVFGNLSGKVVAVSHALADEFVHRTKVRRSKMAVVPNGIEIERFGRPVDREAIRRRLGLRPDARVILAVGNIREIKGYEFLIESFARIVDQDERLSLVICGIDMLGYRANLDRLLAKKGLAGRILFTDFVSDIEAVYGAADLYALTSISEGFSLTTVEAMASLLPVVVTDCIGPREIITTGRDGIIVPRRDPELFGQTMLELIRDPLRSRALGEAGRRTVEKRFSVQESVRGFEELFVDLAAGRPRTDR